MSGNAQVGSLLGRSGEKWGVGERWSRCIMIICRNTQQSLHLFLPWYLGNAFRHVCFKETAVCQPAPRRLLLDKPWVIRCYDKGCYDKAHTV